MEPITVGTGGGGRTGAQLAHPTPPKLSFCKFEHKHNHYPFFFNLLPMPLNASRYKASSFIKHRIFTTKSFSVAYINSSLQIFIFLEDLGCLFQFWVIAVLVNLQVKIYSNEGRKHVTQNWKWSTIRSSKNEGFKRLLVVIFLLGKLFRGPDRSKRTLSSPCTKFVFNIHSIKLLNIHQV